jgi:hypothetical protein
LALPRQHAVPCRQISRGRVHRAARPGSGSLWRPVVCARTCGMRTRGLRAHRDVPGLPPDFEPSDAPGSSRQRLPRRDPCLDRGQRFGILASLCDSERPRSGE